MITGSYGIIAHTTSNNSSFTSDRYNNFGPTPSFHDGIIGQVRYNGSVRNLEVFDGGSWLPLSHKIEDHTTLSFTPEVMEAILWAEQKCREEKKMKELAKAAPIIYEQVKQLSEDRDAAFTAITELYAEKANALFRKAETIKKMTQ